MIIVLMQKGEPMEEKKYRVMWDGDEVARCMRIDDALLFIEALCRKYFNNRINIALLDEPKAEPVNPSEEWENRCLKKKS